MLLLIDNYDSFTWNIIQYFLELGADVEVIRNDKTTIADIEALAPQQLVISPGPCDPNKAGISLECVKHFSGKIPILGICLGHQCMAQAFGGKIVRAEKVMHGKISTIHHSGESVFSGIPNQFNATRYHSLVVDKQQLPECFKVTAWTENNSGEIEEIMGIRHIDYALEGVQFHPEALLTEHGHQLLNNFLHPPL